MAAHKRFNSQLSPFKKILVFFLRYVGFSFFQSRLMVRLARSHGAGGCRKRKWREAGSSRSINSSWNCHMSRTKCLTPPITFSETGGSWTWTGRGWVQRGGSDELLSMDIFFRVASVGLSFCVLTSWANSKCFFKSLSVMYSFWHELHFKNDETRGLLCIGAATCVGACAGEGAGAPSVDAWGKFGTGVLEWTRVGTGVNGLDWGCCVEIRGAWLGPTGGVALFTATGSGIGDL